LTQNGNVLHFIELSKVWKKAPKKRVGAFKFSINELRERLIKGQKKR
jgi:hypothetical protein